MSTDQHGDYDKHQACPALEQQQLSLSPAPPPRRRLESVPAAPPTAAATSPGASASASGPSLSSSSSMSLSSSRPQTVYTTKEEFDDDGNVTKVEDLVFIDGILGQGEGGGTVRLARRRIPKTRRHSGADTSNIGDSDGENKSSSFDSNHQHSVTKDTSKDNGDVDAIRQSPSSFPSHLPLVKKHDDVPTDCEVALKSASSSHRATTHDQQKSRRSRFRGKKTLSKSVSAPDDFSFFLNTNKPAPSTTKNTNGNNRTRFDDDKTERTEKVSHQQPHHHRPHGRKKKSKKERSVVGKLGLFTPSRCGVSFSFDTDDEDNIDEDEEDDEQLVAVKIFSKSILKRRRTMERDRSTRRVKVKTALEQVEREIALMKKLSHPNLLQLYEVIDSEESDMLYMVLEYMPLGEILSYRDGTGTFRRKTRPGAAMGNKYEVDGIVDGHFDEEHAALYFVDILHGLAYLHSHHVCHRDLKPEK